MTIPIAPNKPRSFWETEKGLEVKGYFEAYGAVVKEREVTGDPTAVPAPESTVTGGSRGAPSNVSDILIKYFEVKKWLDRTTKRQAALINFIYVEGLDWETMIRYVYADGTESDWMHEDAPRPMVPVKDVFTESKKKYKYDLDKFECPEIDDVARLWKTTKSALLNREHERAGRIFSACIS